jgi:hypothetical protein
LQTQALGPLLERDLAVNSNTPFKASFDPSLPGFKSYSSKHYFFRIDNETGQFP